ncbi:MAG: hypothetical protein QM493_10305, partial [Sulfurovum sp.]
MFFNLKVPMIIEIKEGAKIVETLSISLRNLTKKEKIEAEDIAKKYIPLSKTMQKTTRKLEKANQKISLLEKANNIDAQIEMLDKIEILEDRLQEDIDAVNVVTSDEFYEDKAKE